jgi:DeoR family suf operon transcriptional repressor
MAEMRAGPSRPTTAASGAAQAPGDLRLAALAGFPATRRALVVTLKHLGEARAEALAESLAITVGGVRQHLAGLEADGLVAHRERKGGPGRPKFVYHLTAAADSLFPTSAADLASELLEYAADEDPVLVDRLFARRAGRRLQQLRPKLHSKPFDERVAALTRALDEDGYVAGFEALDDGTFRITEHNCAILGVARKHTRACGSELDFLRAALPDADIERVTHIVAGAYACSYVVRPRPPAAD